MTYSFTLSHVAIVIGLIYIAAHLPGALAPGFFKRLAVPAPRNYPLGIALTLLAGAWITALTLTADLGELTPYREKMMIVWIVGTIASVFFMPAFLAARGLGLLLLLAASVGLDAAFFPTTPWRYLITVAAYVWVIAGMLLVASPYLLRDWIGFAVHDEKRTRLLCWPGVAFGVALLALGLFVYP